MPDILHLLTIQAPPEKVYQALTTPAGIRSWWTREAELEAWIGGRGEFRFYGGKGVTEVRVEVLEPPLRVGWRVTAANAPGGWEGTTITFDLAEKDGGTLLSFAQRGFARADEGFALVTTGWAYYLVSLQQYLERGKGTPQQDKDFSILAAPRADEARSAPSSPEIRHELGIKASPAAVYEALTEVRKLGQWWIPDTRGESKTGKPLEFWFGNPPARPCRFESSKPTGSCDGRRRKRAWPTGGERRSNSRSSPRRTAAACISAIRTGATARAASPIAPSAGRSSC
jgi:uncharacterized protein YndB with AHSA1/START domain